MLEEEKYFIKPIRAWKKSMIAAKDYCSFINTGLIAWKAKIYNVGRQLEKIDIPEKEKIFFQLEDILL